MANEIEKQTLNFFVMGIREFLGSFDSRGEAPPGRIVIAIFLLLIAFLFVGVEALKVLFRKNFSREAVSVVQIIIAGAAFFGWGWLCFSLKEDNLELEDVFGFAGWFYIALSVLVLVRGVFEWQKSYSKKLKGTILGESTILGFLKNSWWTEYRILMIAEPLTVFAIALPLVAVNFYLGIPLVFCGISQVIFNLIFSIRVVEETSDNLDSDRNQSGNKNLPVQ